MMPAAMFWSVPCSARPIARPAAPSTASSDVVSHADLLQRDEQHQQQDRVAHDRRDDRHDRDVDVRGAAGAGADDARQPAGEEEADDEDDRRAAEAGQELDRPGPEGGGERADFGGGLREVQFHRRSLGS